MKPKNNLITKLTLKDIKNARSSSTEDNQEVINDQDPLLKSLIIRENQLVGNILIGNFKHVTYLEICENDIAVLDLSTLSHLEILKCNCNNMKQLVINGTHLIKLIADHNYLNTITFNQNPANLRFVNISHNKFERLPTWITHCLKIHLIQADHNILQKFTDCFANCYSKSLKIVNLANNRIKEFNVFPKCFESLEELYLHDNEIMKLPDIFLNCCSKKLRILNLSYNKLNGFPGIDTNNSLTLEKLFISCNNLTDMIFGVLERAHKLKVLFAAFNQISQIPEKCLQQWLQLEILVLSGNTLEKLPTNINMLKNLKVLKVHSNKLIAIPNLKDLSNLTEGDFAHNHLSNINLLSIIPLNLKYLDISCNRKLHIEVNEKACQRISNSWRLIDVSGKNRASLPTKDCIGLKEPNSLKAPWSIGFSETLGSSKRMLVRQLRLENFRLNEMLFGMYESVDSCKTASRFVKDFPLILQRQLKKKESSIEFLKTSFLISYKELNPKFQPSALVCHLTEGNLNPQSKSISKTSILRTASMGNIGLFLIKKNKNITLATCSMKKEGPPKSMEEPILHEIILNHEDEYLVICNEHLCNIVDAQRISMEIRKDENCILAAKRIQIVAQSFGATGNISIIVIRLQNSGIHINRLVQEFRRTLRKDKNFCYCNVQNTDVSLYSSTVYHVKNSRSSPSGQSDKSTKCEINQESHNLISNVEASEEIDGLSMTSDINSVLSEEQFKCWEYILEQNTQLLFDKELDTISKTFPNQIDSFGEGKSNLAYSVCKKFISNSYPQIFKHDTLETSQKYFNLENMAKGKLSNDGVHFKYTGAEIKNMNAFVDVVLRPTSAYFGSLQGLEPNEKEYDLIVKGGRAFDHNNIEALVNGTRLQSYWGESSTEL